jgi:hypothetical protein
MMIQKIRKNKEFLFMLIKSKYNLGLNLNFINYNIMFRIY